MATIYREIRTYSGVTVGVRLVSVPDHAVSEPEATRPPFYDQDYIRRGSHGAVHFAAYKSQSDPNYGAYFDLLLVNYPDDADTMHYQNNPKRPIHPLARPITAQE